MYEIFFEFKVFLQVLKNKVSLNKLQNIELHKC